MASLADLSYDQLMALVYALPALHPTGVASVMVGSLAAVIAINTITTGLRIYSRTILTRGAFGVDDTLAILGYVCYLVATVYAIQGALYGIGTTDSAMPNELYSIRAEQLLLWVQIAYIIGTPLIKGAIAVQVMRLTPSLYYRVPLWFVIVGSTCSALALLVTTLVQCKPISATWTGQGVCSSLVPMVNVAYLFTAVAIVSDFTCALLPFFLIRGLNMSARRKWSLIGVLSIGVIACIFTIVRVAFLKHFLIAENSLYYKGYIVLTTMLEEGVGMFAASLPSMRTFFTKFYGSSKSGNGNVSNAGGGPSADFNRAIGGSDGTQLNTLHSSVKRGQFSATVSAAAQGTWAQGSTWEALDDDDANSRHGIIVQHDVFLQTGDSESQRNTGSMSESDDPRYEK